MKIGNRIIQTVNGIISSTSQTPFKKFCNGMFLTFIKESKSQNIPLMEDEVWLKTTLVGRHSLMEDDLWWKKAFDGRKPLMKGNLWWETTFDGRQP